MKTSIKIMTLLVSTTMALASCEKTEEGLRPDLNPASERAQAALAARYPDASGVRWTAKDKYVVARFSLPVSRAAETGSSDLAAWFDNGGAWYMTETDIPFAVLPEAVRRAFEESEYAQWRVDDVDRLEREGVETIYVIEVEKRENGRETEVDLYYSADGVLVKTIVDSGSDYDYGDYIPSKPTTSVEEYIRTHYPNARITDIDYERGMTEVEILDGRTCRELLFDNSGAWLYTKTEVRRTEVPESVMTALQNSEYASYQIDDIDHYETPDKEFYRFDLESVRGDVKVDIALDSTLTLKQSDGNAPDTGNGQLVNAAVSEFISTKYPGARIVEYDYDDGLLEVEIRHENRDKDVYFNGRTEWVRTEWDIRLSELPEAVSAAISASQWATFTIDDLEYVQTSAGDYYLVELERGKQEVELRITAEGNIL